MEMKLTKLIKREIKIPRAAIFTGAIALLLSLPATAQLLPEETSQLGQLWSDFQLYTTELQDYFVDNLKSSLQSVESEVDIALEASKGELNIPNPLAANRTISNEIIVNSWSDEFENNSVVYAQDVNNEINRLITRGRVGVFLQPEAQIRLKDKLVSTEDAIKKIAQITSDADDSYRALLDGLAGGVADAALNSLVSRTQSSLDLQNIQIQGEQAKITGEVLGQTIEMRQSLQYTNLNLASISQQVEQQNRARRFDDSAEAARLLRNTFQTDLIGRGKE